MKQNDELHHLSLVTNDRKQDNQDHEGIGKISKLLTVRSVTSAKNIGFEVLDPLFLAEVNDLFRC